MKKEQIRPVEFDEDGNPVLNSDADAANADWIRARRLLLKAQQGDREAKAKLQKLFDTKMVRLRRETQP